MVSPVGSSDITPTKPFKSAYQITAKLDSDNFPVWLQQVEPMLCAHKLHCFCASPQIPLCFLSYADRDAENENLAFVDWELQDQLLLAWLQSSLTPLVLVKVIGCRNLTIVGEDPPSFSSQDQGASAPPTIGVAKHTERHQFNCGVLHQNKKGYACLALYIETDALVPMMSAKLRWSTRN